MAHANESVRFDVDDENRAFENVLADRDDMDSASDFEESVFSPEVEDYIMKSLDEQFPPTSADLEHRHKKCKPVHNPPSSTTFRPIQIRSMADRPRPAMVNPVLVRSRQFSYNEVVQLIGMARDEIKNGYHRAGVDPALDPTFDSAWIHFCLAHYHSAHPPQ